ncbi:MAG: TIGR02300 family protein [Geminicoccaceae bacterium]|nr:TIGR02300 family protein [Geminicoccaceae bacterium]
MAKPEWGTKRVCLSCGAKFYDFHRSPIFCPACGAEYDVEAAGRARRARPASRALAESEPVVPADVEEVEEEEVPLEELETEAELEEGEEPIEEEPVEVGDEDVILEDEGDLGEDETVGDVLEEEIGPEENEQR